jgi:hypothetical protein
MQTLAVSFADDVVTNIDDIKKLTHGYIVSGLKATDNERRRHTQVVSSLNKLSAIWVDSRTATSLASNLSLDDVLSAAFADDANLPL